MYFGIDLGTTNSLISVFENGQARLISKTPMVPSVVAFLDGALVVGSAAKERLSTHPKNTVAAFKRAMGTEKKFKLGRHNHSAVDLSAMVLSHLKNLACAETGVDVHDVVISVPAYFNQLQRDAVRAAALSADLKPLRLINEPTAAAIAYGLQDIDEQGHILVFDLGGGTFDVSIIEVFEGVLEVKATSGDAFLGGEDFTKVLFEHLALKHGISIDDVVVRSRLWDVAEKLKLHLSTSHCAECNFVRGDQTECLSISRDTFAEIAAGLVRRLRLPVERAMYDAKLTSHQIDKVVLVGGATRMPLVRAQVSRMTGKLPEVGIDPDHVVALGAAFQAALTENDSALDDVVMTDVSAFSLGFSISRQFGNRVEHGFFEPVIERNTVIPASREHIFQTMELGQTEVDLDLYQGESPRVLDNIKLGSMKVKVPRNLKEHEEIAVRLSYDVSGLLEVDTTVLSTQKNQSVSITNLTGGLSERQIASRKKALKALKVHPKDNEGNLALSARIERCYAMALAEDRSHLQDLLLAFQVALNRQDPNEIQALRYEITEQLDQFEANYVR
ncbi:molecular chaperone HscC [Parasedimentitalea marina]|uniref:Molecular chaperone HscC n=1 Tax=Parasedimentitalea marina TaxID=2483033 RepID=A0A3T0N1U1_9RHOB|nr:Hsp70 family protein [Parasedimentitalea marina]AZV77993.1 molecular chaperone HscC [Parasedimentitalea marina]